MPDTAAAHRAEERLDRVAAEPRVDRQRVGARRLALEVGVGIRARRRADVAALAVGDDQQPGAPGVGADLVEGRHPGRPERLEEGELRLHGDGVRRDRVDQAAAEAGDVAAQLDRHQVDVRVEPDDELRMLALDLGGEPVGEGGRRGHGHRLER